MNWPRGGVQGRRFCENGVWRPIREAAALRLGWRAWVEAGGAAAMGREAGKARRAGDWGETRAAALLVADMQRRGQEVPRLLLDMGCSRRPLFTSAGTRVRVLLNGQTVAGAAADARGRWAVKEITAWRGGFADREAWVVWQGFHPSTGEPWPTQWVARNRLSKDLRSGGLIRPKRAAAPLPPAAVGGKRSSRLAGAIPVAPMESEAAVRKKARADKAAAAALAEEREAEEVFVRCLRRRQAAGGGAGGASDYQLCDGCCGQTCLHLARGFQIGASEDGGRVGAGQLRSGGGEHA